MTEFKCKYCGNHLHPKEGQTLITCSRCDEVTRIVSIDNAKRKRLLDEADDLRINCLFDRAMQKYESIIQEFPKDSDAYWGYVLCIYGVEFQEDPRSGKRLPTLHRISSRSIMQDPYYQKAINYANPMDAIEYKRIAAELDRIRIRFIELSQKEENKYDIFISFKQTDDRLRCETIDCSKAENLYYKLQEMGYRVFFSKVTLANRGGDDFEPIIYMALESSKLMIVLGSSRENLESPWVRNEWNRFMDMMRLNPTKKIIPALVQEMRPDLLPNILQGIQGYNVDTQVGMDRLLSRVVQLCPIQKSAEAQKSEKFTASEKSLLKRAKMEAKARNWDKALEYYNRILDVNPECAEAWIGLMLSSADIPFTEVDEYKEYLLEKWLSVEKESKTVSFREGDGDFMSSRIIPNYLSENEIKNILPSELLYVSTCKSLQKNLDEAKTFFATNQGFCYAIKYADDEQREKLKHLENDVLNKIEDTLETKKREEAETEEKLKKEYADKLTEAKRIVDAKYQAALTAREVDYNEGMGANTSNDVPAAITKLTRVGSYKDAPKKLQALMVLQKVIASIGDRKDYYVSLITAENPQAVIDLQNAVQQTSVQSRGLGKWIELIIYILLMLELISSSNILSIGCIILGCILGRSLWKKNNPNMAYFAFSALHIMAGAFFDMQFCVVLLIIFVESMMRKNGYAKILMEKKLRKVAISSAEKVISNWEEEARASVDEVWKAAIGIPYDGIKQQSVLNFLKEHNYVIEMEDEHSFDSIENYVTSEVDKALQQANEMTDNMEDYFKKAFSVFNNVNKKN